MLAATLGLLLPLCLAPAASEPPRESLPVGEVDDAMAKAAWEAGLVAYRDGRLEQAIEQFERTFLFSGRPGPLFSLGQAHRHRYDQEGDPRQRHLAILRYQQYLDLDPEGKRRVEAERHIAELMSLSELELEGPDPPPMFTRLSVTGSAVDAWVVVDDGPETPLPATVDVEPGEHRVVVGASGFHRWTRTVHVAQGSTLPVEAALRELEAHLRVRAPAAADLYVDGERVGAIPSPDAVTVTPGVHQIGVARPGRSLFVRELRLERAETREIDVELEVTGQRKVAYSAMGVGAGAVAASAALVGVAMSAQRRGLRIEEARDDGSITLADENERAELVARRNAMRTAAIATGATGLVLVGVGVILYVTDRPPVASQLHAPGVRRRRVLAGPVLAPHAAGASLSGSF